MAKRICYEVSGDCPSHQWEPEEFIDCETIEEFERDLISGAEDSASWGCRVVGDTIQGLWEEVQEKKQEPNE